MRIHFWCLIVFAFHVSACSKESNAGTSGLKPAETVAVNSEVNNLQNTPAPTVESEPTPNPRDVVLFDGKNYIKKSGWKVPSRNDTRVDDTYDKDTVKGKTEKGKEVEIATIRYIYKTPWFYSQDFYYEGRDLDYMKGNLKADGFSEMSVNGKVFLYNIGGGKVVTPPASNSEHEDPFGYWIQDRDGDGIFETLLWHDGDIIVPNWVLK